MTNGELKLGEPHPMAYDAMQWIRSWMSRQSIVDFQMLREAMASTAISGNRLGEVCGETLDRLLKGEMVSDRYLLGLAWFVRNYELMKEEKLSKCCKGRMIGGVQCEVCGSNGD